jgi:hypothetical protein
MLLQLAVVFQAQLRDVDVGGGRRQVEQCAEQDTAHDGDLDRQQERQKEGHHHRRARRPVRPPDRKPFADVEHTPRRHDEDPRQRRHDDLLHERGEEQDSG